MSNELTIGIIGLYTLVYFIVFFIQKSQIDKTKEINASMKSFIDIFRIEEVKKYVELKNERIMMQVEQLICNDEKIREISIEALNLKIEDIKKIYLSQMGDEHLELVLFAIEVIKSQPEEKRLELINKAFPKTKRYFFEILKDINSGEI